MPALSALICPCELLVLCRAIASCCRYSLRAGAGRASQNLRNSPGAGVSVQRSQKWRTRFPHACRSPYPRHLRMPLADQLLSPDAAGNQNKCPSSALTLWLTLAPRPCTPHPAGSLLQNSPEGVAAVEQVPHNMPLVSFPWWSSRGWGTRLSSAK